MKTATFVTTPAEAPAAGGGMFFADRRRFLQALGTGALALAATGGRAEADTGGGAATALGVIRSRRSIREYTGEPVPQKDLQEILAAGMSAPSAKNSRPWHFVVLTGSRIGLISRSIPLTAYTAKAGAAVLVCVDTTVEPGREQAMLSTACCVENMLLAAHALGYGSVWVDLAAKPDIAQIWREALRLPAEMLPLCVLPIGRPAVTPPPQERVDASRIHYDSW